MAWLLARLRATGSLLNGSHIGHPATRLVPLRRFAAASDLGKGVEDILADVDEGQARKRTFLGGYDELGFDVHDILYRGSIMAFPNACLLWKPRKLQEVTPESLSPLLMVKPPIEILIVGTGARLDKTLPEAAKRYLKRQGIAVEHMNTGSACATFNILNQEDRRVAAALVVDADTDTYAAER